MSARTYAQNCGLALALDLLGERWTMLVVRELALGPKRFRDLLANLPGIGTNLLSARLKTLEAAGAARRATLPPPAGVHVYELTERGEELRAPLTALALWGFPLLPEDLHANVTRAAWIALSMAAVCDREHGGALPGSVAFAIGNEHFDVRADGGETRVRQGVPGPAPDARVSTDLPTFVALAGGSLEPATARARGRLAIDGDAAVVDELFTVFHLPR